MSSIQNELALFQPVPTEHAVNETKWVNFRPTSQISDTGPIEFNISPTSSYYVLLGKTVLNLKVKITKKDGTDIAAENISLSNLALSSCFRQCDVSLNQQIINPSVNTNYPYKAFIDVLLKYNHAVKEGQLQGEGYAKDLAFYFDRSDNAALSIRKEWTKNSIIADFQGMLHVDLAQQDRAILNNVGINVKLWQSNDEFRLFSGTSEAENGKDFKLNIVDAVLKVCYLKLNPSTMLAHSERLNSQVARYPYWKSVVKSFGIPQGSYSFTIEDLFFGSCPNRLIVGFVLSSAYSGDMGKNPFNFQHFNLNFLEFSLDSVSVPGTPFTPKYVEDPSTGTNGLPKKTYKNGYINEYLSLFQAQYPQKDGNFISREEYPGGYNLYVFDIKPGTNKHLFSKVINGHTRLSGRFETALAEPVVAVVYGTFPDKFAIDQSRLVIQ